jgi:3-keto-disaccharide hydrolase
MIMTAISRRQVVGSLAGLGACVSAEGIARSAAADDPFDVSRSLDGWETASGDWVIEDVPGAARNGRALVQRASANEYNVILAPGGPYGNVVASVRFRPMAGAEDASGGIVFRFADGRYYLVRANALEDNFRLYYYDGGRRMITSASIKAPALGQWHKLQVSASADRIQGWLNDRLLIDQSDKRFVPGRLGLWTKADSVTAFDDLTVLPLDG